MNKQDIKLLEANFLDGDSIDDCGACTHSTVMDIVDFFQERNNKKISKLLGDIVAGIEKRRGAFYSGFDADLSKEIVNDIINKSEFSERDKLLDN